MPRPIVALGFLGTRLDAGMARKRLQRWRPTINLAQRRELGITRLELIYDDREEGWQQLARVIQSDFESTAPGSSVNLHPMTMRNPWDFEEVYGALHDFARRYPFKPDDEDYLVHVTTGSHVQQICLFLLTESRHFPGKLVQTGPPEEDDPIGRATVIDLSIARYDRLARRFEKETSEATSFLKSGIATRSSRFNRIIDEIERVALAADHPILLMGPTGAGKSQIARRIFELKKQRHQLAGQFVEVNCATLRGDTAMATLFGHVKGAYTGAHAPRAGLLRTAHRGVLFLDEIGELGADEQAMLLRALEEKRFLPVGSDREIESDFQLLAGTNRDLRAAAAAGRFRDDLLARINLWTFELPGLAERAEDIEPNLDYELERFASRSGRRVTFNREARDHYLAFATAPQARWAGNFRDLNASVTRMATLAPQGRIDQATVGDELRRLEREWEPRDANPEDATLARILEKGAARGGGGPAKLDQLDRFDLVQLADVVRVCRAARSLADAGRRLFTISRAKKSGTTNDSDRLRKYLARFGLEFQDARDPV